MLSLSAEGIATFLGVEVLRKHAASIPLKESRFLELWSAAVPVGMATSLDMIKVVPLLMLSKRMSFVCLNTCDVFSRVVVCPR